MNCNDEAIISGLIDEEIKSQHTILRKITIDGEEYEFENRELPVGISICIPKSFDILNPALARKKYLMEDRPKFIYSNRDTTVNLCFSLYDKYPISLRERVLQYKTIIKKMNATNVIEMSDVITGSSIEYGCFAYAMEALDKNVYVFVFFADLDTNELYGSFNCAYDFKDDWFPLIFEMLNSIKLLKDKKENSDDL